MTQTFIPGKDAALEDSIARFQQKLSDLGFQIEEASWLNPCLTSGLYIFATKSAHCVLPTVKAQPRKRRWLLHSVNISSVSQPTTFCGLLAGRNHRQRSVRALSQRKWFPLTENDDVPEGLLDDRLRAFYDPENELTGSMLIDLQSGNEDRGICGLPFTRQSDNQTVYIPMNIIGNLYVSNGMSAGNTRNEARVQGLSEVFERYVKNRIIAESISLPEIPADVLARYPAVVEAIETLEAEGSQSSLMTVRLAASIR